MALNLHCFLPREGLHIEALPGGTESTGGGVLGCRAQRGAGVERVGNFFAHKENLFQCEKSSNSGGGRRKRSSTTTQYPTTGCGLHPESITEAL